MDPNRTPVYVNQYEPNLDNPAQLLKQKQLENPNLLKMKAAREEQQKQIQIQIQKNQERLNNTFDKTSNFAGNLITDSDV